MTKAVRINGLGFKPSFAAMAAAYPRKSIKRAELYEELGIGELTNRPEYENTCAIRMSYAVTKAGVNLLKGGLRINHGAYKGKRLEPSMRKLAAHLAELWGAPEKYDSEDSAKQSIAGRKGVVAFFFTEGLPVIGAQGHIDLVWPTANGFFQCAGACFFGPRNRVWFWPLN